MSAIRVTAPADLNWRTAKAFRESVLDKVESTTTLLVIDVGECRDIDSSSLGALVHIHRSCWKRRIPVRLVRVTDDLQTLFELTALDRLFQRSLEPTLPLRPRTEPRTYEAL